MQRDRPHKIQRILAIGDIHGCYKAFRTLLQAVDPGPDDLLIMLGDYIDRGPESKNVVDRLIALDAEMQVVFLAGNHEEMLLAWRDKEYSESLMWWVNGGPATLRSYCLGDESLFQRLFRKAFISPQADDFHAEVRRLIPEAHWDFFENCLDWYETDGHIFVHGQVNPDLDMALQSPHVLHWGRFRADSRAHKSGKRIICGHTQQTSGRPLDTANAACIDTYAYGGQWLTCLDVLNNKYYQANSLGGTRRIA